MPPHPGRRCWLDSIMSPRPANRWNRFFTCMMALANRAFGWRTFPHPTPWCLRIYRALALSTLPIRMTSPAMTAEYYPRFMTRTMVLSSVTWAKAKAFRTCSNLYWKSRTVRKRAKGTDMKSCFFHHPFSSRFFWKIAVPKTPHRLLWKKYMPVLLKNWRKVKAARKAPFSCGSITPGEKTSLS
ncbi:MAG: hypothetical protein BWY09_02289 [Candidatus Hydrogenedentes bacterium ADurb.Bin179]|nr:MAG: hypothetical protein BWY09_02289 [Candidatus Hydrogenedentes bacterium ADurb.Bin179]